MNEGKVEMLDWSPRRTLVSCQWAMSDDADEEMDVADERRRKWVGVRETFRRLAHSECSSLLPSSPSKWMNLKREREREILRKRRQEQACATWRGVLLSPNRSGKIAQDKSSYGYTLPDYWLSATEMWNLIEDTQHVLNDSVTRTASSHSGNVGFDSRYTNRLTGQAIIDVPVNSALNWPKLLPSTLFQILIQNHPLQLRKSRKTN